MSFNAALSGLRSASTDLKVTGNNIANASTTGFKASRVEFGDVYASSVLGSGSAQTGGGSRVQDIAQQFAQGNISFTSSQLDLAISGQGFFMVEQNDSRLFSRAGTFSLDDSGFVVNNTGGRLQGFEADRFGNVAGVVSDIRIETGNQAPRQTTGVTSSLNLNSSEAVLQRNGVTFESNGSAVAQAQQGVGASSTTQVQGTFIANTSGVLSTPIDITDADPIEFTIGLTGADANNNSVTIVLDQDTIGTTSTSITTITELAEIINNQILNADPRVDIFAEVSDDKDQLSFFAVQEGEGPAVTITAANYLRDYVGDGTADEPGDLREIGFNPGTTTNGVSAVSNNYPAQSFTVTGPNGNEVSYTSIASAPASETASAINNLAGVSASALTTATILDTSTVGEGFVLNQVPLSGNNFDEIVDQINALTNSTLPGISAELDADGNMVITSIVGDDLSISLYEDPISTAGLGSFNIVGGTDPGVTPEALTSTTNAVVIGGVIDVVLDEGYAISNIDPPFGALFTPLAVENAAPFSINAFDPADPATYNHATSLSIYDSLGEAHVMTQYFVKQEYDPTDPAKNEPNVWKMYVQIDGEDVGDPDTTLAPPLNTLPTVAEFTLRFNPDGSLNTESSSQLLVSNWTPKDADGNISGALGAINRLEGATFPVEEPAVSSNFSIDMGRTTQFSSDFAVNSVDQNGYTTGLLTGLTIDSEGIIFARYTNGESVALSQLALANFDNAQGLQPQGDSMWAENFESGEALIGTAGSGSLGVVQAGALEESNVDLSEQLVNLIIAQRNFQANAKTIETANQITQTIINLR